MCLSLSARSRTNSVSTDTEVRRCAPESTDKLAIDTERCRPCPGADREFDRDQALRGALCVFWDRGYQGASISALTAAMGIGSPSLYAAFGSKAKLFQEATDLYLAEDAGEPTPPRVRRDRPGVGRGDAAVERRPVHPRGRARRLHAHPGGLDDSRRRPRGQRVPRRQRRAAHPRHRGAARARAADGEELPCLEVRALAEFFDAVVEGMAVRSIEGASRASLHRIVDLTMRIWDVESTESDSAPPRPPRPHSAT